MISEAAWKKWLRFETWSAHEAVALILGIDPANVDDAAAAALQAAFQSGRMDDIERGFTSCGLMAFFNKRRKKNGKLHSSNERHPPKAWIEAATNHGFELPYPAEIITAKNQTNLDNGPWRSDNLALTLQAAQKWWAYADPSDPTTHPINADVADWLNKKGMSRAMADSAARIIRPEWAHQGRKPKA